MSAALGAEVQLAARMADTPVASSRALGHTALFCLLALAARARRPCWSWTRASPQPSPPSRAGGAPGPTLRCSRSRRFERALLAELLLTVLAALRELGAAESRWRPRLLEVGAGRARGRAAPRTGSLPGASSSALETAAVHGRAVLLLPELALRAVALALPTAGGARPGPGPGHARLSFSPRVRCGSVWPHELAAARPGGGGGAPRRALADGVLHGPAGARAARSGRSPAALSAEGLRHSGAELHAPSQEVTHVDPALSELPVELEVELARVPLSLAEVGALQPGAVLPLRVSAGDPVFLRAGDRRIARAELVDVEGEVAARVLELVP